MDRRLVYFIQAGAGGPIKVGIAVDPSKRLRDLQTANPHQLRLIGSFAGGRVLEAAIHEALDHCRLEGEWFELCDDTRRVYRRLALATQTLIDEGLTEIALWPFQTEIAVSGENGGGGNRTRVTSQPDASPEQAERASAAAGEPRPRLCNTAESVQ